jgi:hypothetical protein
MNYLLGTRRPKRVKSTVLTIGRLLPVYLDKQTFSVSVGMSQRCQIRTLSALGGAPLDDARLGIVKHFTSVPYCSNITCRIRLAEPIGQRLSACIMGTTFSAPSRAGTCI